MSLAQQPYSEVDCFEMAAYLREGYRIAHPINCPDELYVTNQHSDFLFPAVLVDGKGLLETTIWKEIFKDLLAWLFQMIF